MTDKDKPFVRLPQGGYKMYTDGKNPRFEKYDAGDFAIDAGFVLQILIVLAIAAITLKSLI